jgi:ketosteroid isomerase-like protein
MDSSQPRTGETRMRSKDQIEMDDVVAANDRFYEAICALDLEEMDQIWAESGDVRCIHPGWDVVAGTQAVRESWQAIFESSPGLSVEPDEVEVSLFGDIAWVHCMERISLVGDEDEETSFARATNLFIRAGEGWRMILHHASPIPAPDGMEPTSIH